jgi:hypothetical protein
MVMILNFFSLVSVFKGKENWCKKANNPFEGENKIMIAYNK